MTRRLLLAIVLMLALAAPAFGDDIVAQKQAVYSKLATLNGSLARVQHEQSSLRDQIGGLDARIRTLESKVGDVSLQLSALEQDLGLRQERLKKLNRLFALQSTRLRLLRQQYKLSLDRLDARLVAIYESPEPSTLDVVLGSASIEDAIDLSNYVARIGAEDKEIAHEVARSKHAVALARL